MDSRFPLEGRNSFGLDEWPGLVFHCSINEYFIISLFDVQVLDLRGTRKERKHTLAVSTEKARIRFMRISLQH